MTRKVLIVVSSYAPTMIADMHRARHLAWTLPQHGWDVEILAPDSSFQKPDCLDSDSVEFFSKHTPVHWVSPRWRSVFDWLRMGNIGWRAMMPMFLKGRDILRKKRFDMVYISTTQFPLFLLGRWWYRACRVPYVLDIHDPCCREGGGKDGKRRSSLKHEISRLLSCLIERLAVRLAAGIVAVSPAYIENLKVRYAHEDYPWMSPGCHCVIPFSVLSQDYEEGAKRISLPSKMGAKSTCTRKIVYVGAGGPIMKKSFGLLCRSLAYIYGQEPELLDEVLIELYGTHLGWREGDPCYLAEIAEANGVTRWVFEDPRRVTYCESLNHLLDADGALILGVEDDGYMPSKLFTYAWSGKPLLAVLRRNSPASLVFKDKLGLGHVIWFDVEESMPETEAAVILKSYLSEVKSRRLFERQDALESYTAPAMACRHAELFRLCLLEQQVTSL